MANISLASGDAPKAAWGDLLRDGRGVYTALLILGTLMQAIQILVIAIIMPTVVADIGGAAFFTWAAMSYAVGSIVGAAAVGPIWRALGARNGYSVSGAIFFIGTIASAMAPAMATLIAARALQGFGGGLIIGGTLALISALFEARLRTRILALYQGSWTISHMFGPLVGGLFAEIGWWRGSFWVMAPLIACFTLLAWWKVPAGIDPGKRGDSASLQPIFRLTLLAVGVVVIATAGPVESTLLRVVLIVAALAMIWGTFRLDQGSSDKLFPDRAISVLTPVGLALWILFLTGIAQQALILFLPLLLQVVHGVSPVWISYVTIVISVGWTIGTFAVSGWSGARERFALWIGPVLMLLGLIGITVTAKLPLLSVLTASAFIFGLGIGTHNVHMVSRTMAAAVPGEEGVTAAAMTSIRSLGAAFGAALAGMLANIGGLGNATDPIAVANAVTFVYSANILPMALTVIFMFMLLRVTSRPV